VGQPACQTPDGFEFLCLPEPLRSLLQPAGAMLLQSTDISTASGLDPASLRKALVPRKGDALLTGGKARGPKGPSAQLSK